jgi:N-acetyl-anhydromuramyl-L-alanine amidase AmpD
MNPLNLTGPPTPRVLHATESPEQPGSSDLLGLARYFRRAGLASHVADDAKGSSIRLVGDDRLAYHATFWNDVSVGIEQVGFSSFTRAQWLARPAQLATTARWVAYWARRYRIPIRRCAVTGLRYDRNDRVSAGTMVRRGVCSHAQLDPRNRDDPGRGYPWDVVLARARAIANRAPGRG